MKKIKIILILVIVSAVVAGFFACNLIYFPVSGDSKPAYFKVESGQSVGAIAKNLERDKLIKNALAFKIYARLKGSQNKILAGEYQLNINMSSARVFAVLTSGNIIENEKTITIIEGWRAEEIGAYLEQQGIVSQKEFYANITAGQWREEFDFLKDVKTGNVEGFLFPDTYKIFADATAEDIVRKMLQNFEAKVTPKMRADIEAQGKGLYEIMIMASIVEREALSDSDKAMVADVFWKRVKDGIGLQSDATINYITNKKNTRSTSEDLKIDSPYNTYKYRGLPPGPISNPGLSAIKAAVYPTKNDYYYFITDSSGKAIFAETFEEHQGNIGKYLK